MKRNTLLSSLERENEEEKFHSCSFDEDQKADNECQNCTALRYQLNQLQCHNIEVMEDCNALRLQKDIMQEEIAKFQAAQNVA